MLQFTWTAELFIPGCLITCNTEENSKFRFQVRIKKMKIIFTHYIYLLDMS